MNANREDQREEKDMNVQHDIETTEEDGFRLIIFCSCEFLIFDSRAHASHFFVYYSCSFRKYADSFSCAKHNAESPFEFRALEVALEAICSYLAARTLELETAVYPALDMLTSKVCV